MATLHRPDVTDAVLMAAVQEHGSHRAAAKALGLHSSTVDRRVRLLALKGWSPEHDMTKTVPDGFTVSGTSTLYDEHGKPRLQWVKSRQDAEQVRKLFEAFAAGLADELPRAKPVRAPAASRVMAELANTYVVTDYHLGMLSWHEETGEDWDLSIAEAMFVDWFRAAIEMAPPAEIGILAQLGDFLHFDGLEAVTPTSRHTLDADTRFQKLVRAAIRIVRQVIAMLLEKHSVVRVLMAEGNHDMASSIWLRELLAAIYEDEPRVLVELSPDPYYCVEHGETALFFHHGHKSKLGAIDDVFVAKFREVYGRTKHAYAHMGHLHHVDIKETNLMTVEQHRTLSAKDAYASRGGWMSGRDAKVITYHKKFGEVSRLTISPQMLEAA